MTQPIPAQPPTQTRHPWRATVRTVFAATVGALLLIPAIAATLHIEAVPAVGVVIVVAGAVTRVLAMPAVDAWLAWYVPWLAAQPQHPFGG